MKLAPHDLRLFAAIADTGGITSAAHKLGLTKSLVSRDLAALEAALGVRLVQRTTRKISLTEGGELLATFARRISEELENAEAAMDATRATPSGELKLSIPFSVLRYLIIPRLHDFRRRYPEITLAFDATTRVVDLVEEGIDLAIRVGPLASSSLVARRLAMIPLILVAAPSYLARRGTPSSPSDLLAHDIVNLKRDLSPEIWTLTASDSSVHQAAIRPVIAFHDPGLILDVAVHGHGVAPMPLPYVQSALSDGSLVQVLPGFTRGETPVHAVYPSRRILAPKVRAFVEFAADVIGGA